MKHFDEARQIWRRFVPPSGQATTVQGELLRAVEKPRDGAMRNGNGNWDQGFEILLDFLGNKLDDRAVFTAERIAGNREALARPRNFENPCLDDELYDQFSDCVVEYFRFHGSQPHTKNLNLRR